MTKQRFSSAAATSSSLHRVARSLDIFSGTYFQRGSVSGVKRSGDDWDDSLIACPLTNSSTVFSSGMAYDGQCNWIYAVCDIKI